MTMTASPHRIVVVSLFLLLIIEPLFSSASEAVCDAASGTCSSTTDVTSPYGEPQLTDNTAVIRQHLEDVDRYMRQIVFLEDKYLTVRDRCMNRHELCTFWATAGECTNSDFMTNECAPACFACDQLITDTPFDTAEEDLSLMYGEPQEIDGIEAASTIRRLHQVDAYMRETVFKEEKYAKVRNNCINRHSQCTFWASIGECEANFAYMQTNCSPACMSCDKLIFEDRCPIDTSAPEIWGPGDLNKLFSRIVTEPYYQQYKPVIIGQPGMENPHTGDIPWIVVLEEFLTEEECETLIELGAKQGYERSEDVGEETFDGTYGSVQSRERTSSNAWCQEECYDHPITKRIVQRMENLTGIPDENSEHFQLLRYNVGEFYGVHHDYVPHHVQRQQGPRIMTIYLYLNDVEEGGGTHFHDVDQTVMPKRGRALLWPSVKDDDPNLKDPRTHHSAMPVIKGVKYGANVWLHLRDFKNTYVRNCI